MKNFILTGSFIFLVSFSYAQAINLKLQKAFQQFESDEQLKHAISSLYVIDAKTGKIAFDKNSQVGLAPASTQKIITSVTAFELLGKEYRYRTELGYKGTIKNDVLDGAIYLLGTGDPTLGSWRWNQTSDSFLLRHWVNELKRLKIGRINGSVIANSSRFHYNAIPDGWIWQDIGNYYGAGSSALNWKENQFELRLKSENKIGGRVEVFKNGEPADLVNKLKAAAKGTGDNAFIYYNKSISGTIPVGEKNFSVSGAILDPATEILNDLHFALLADKIQSRETYKSDDSTDFKGMKIISVHYSPSLDSIIYWFNKKSINLYGEALMKTFSYEKDGFGSTEGGVAIVKEFWKQKGLDEDELNISDGSGLSPQNRVTTHAQVEILKYARSKTWFPYFYNSLPQYNGMYMKSGTIKDVKGFCGYQKAKDGKEYIFSFLVNNYSGPTAALVNKMYKVLDVLK